MRKYNGSQRTANLCSNVVKQLVTNVNSKFTRISYEVLSDKRVMFTNINGANLNTVVVLDKFSARELNSKLWQLV